MYEKGGDILIKIITKKITNAHNKKGGKKWQFLPPQVLSK